MERWADPRRGVGKSVRLRGISREQWRRVARKRVWAVFYLPKLESAAEAALWRSAFEIAETRLGLPPASIRATVLIETILAAFEMDEILYALGPYATALNAGRWDYLFSIIKKFRDDPAFVLPDRRQITMTAPFMQAYSDLIVRTCHRRGAHAIGGMAAFVPSRRDPDVNERALAAVRADKNREASAGFDGTWVAHPDLVAVATEVFNSVLGDRPNQLSVLRGDVVVDAGRLLDVAVPDSSITEAGLRNNVAVCLRYLESWLRGTGAVAVFNLMEDVATAEIARAQVWQWCHHGVMLDDGRAVTPNSFVTSPPASSGRCRTNCARPAFLRGARRKQQNCSTLWRYRRNSQSSSPWLSTKG